MISGRANAAVKDGGQQVALTLGMADPLGSDVVDNQSARFGTLGPAVGASYLYRLEKHAAIGADFNYKFLGTKDIATGDGPVEIKSRAWTLLAIGRADLLPDADIRPYGFLGLGAGGIKRSVDFSQSPRFTASQSSYGVALALGAGVDYDINPDWVAGAELRYSFIKTGNNEVGASHVSTIDLLLKVGYKF